MSLTPLNPNTFTLFCPQELREKNIRLIEVDGVNYTLEFEGFGFELWFGLAELLWLLGNFTG